MNPDDSNLTAGRQEEAVRRMEFLISSLLRIGVTTSLAIIVFGAILSFLHHPSYLHSAADLSRLTNPRAAPLHRIADIAAGLRAWHGQAFIMAGLLLLIATPILRVAASVAAFAAQRDRVFAAIAAAGLLLLIIAFALGKIA